MQCVQEEEQLTASEQNMVQQNCTDGGDGFVLFHVCLCVYTFTLVICNCCETRPKVRVKFM